MTPTEIATVVSAIQRNERDQTGRVVTDGIFPRIRWSKEEWSVFVEGLATIDVDADQAIAALRNLKRNSDKYPSVAAVTRALKQAESRPAMTAEASVADDRPWRLARMREAVGATSYMTNEAAVCEYWRTIAFPRSVELRGCITPAHVDNMADDLFVLASVPEDLAAMMATEVASMFPFEPPDDYPSTDLQVRYVEMLARRQTNPKTGTLPPVRSVIEHHVVSPDRRKKAREAWRRIRQMSEMAAADRASGGGAG